MFACKLDAYDVKHFCSKYADELESFENAWARNSRSLPGWPGSSNGFDNIGNYYNHSLLFLLYYLIKLYFYDLILLSASSHSPTFIFILET